MKPTYISVLIISCALLGLNSPITPVKESGLALRHSGELAEYFDQHELVKRLSATVYSGTLALLGSFTGGVCSTAFTSVGANVPANIGCAISGVATLAYAAWAHFREITTPRSLETLDRTPNGLYDYIHLFPGDDQLGSPIDQLQGVYDGSERVLVIHHPCNTVGCYNVFYDNHYDATGDLVHHLAMEPRGTWHLAKRTEETGPERNKGAETHTNKGTAFFADYDFYDFSKSVEHTLGTAGSAKSEKIDFLEGTYTNSKDLGHAGYFCMNWSYESASQAGTKGVYWQSEGEHMADPDALPSQEAKCKTFVDS